MVRGEHRVANPELPEQEPADIRVASEITKVLRNDERSVVFGINETSIVDGICLNIIVG